jgi:SAM-dependent methyltransferase
VSTDTKPIADFFDRECCAAVDAGASAIPGSAGVTQVLLDALADARLVDATVLELGSGAGALSQEMIRRGAATVTGIDLSPASVEHANAAAARAGLSGVLNYQVGDASAVPLGEYDVVVSQKVFCCYPSPDQLLVNTLPAARAVYALVLPESRGLVGLIARLFVAIENGLDRIKRDPFRAYVHDVWRIEAWIRANGFERRLTHRHWAWRVLVYERRRP